MGQWPGQPQTPASAPITLDEAKAIAQQYLVSLGDPNLAVKEIMEFQYNFYVIFYEKDSGLGALDADLEASTILRNDERQHGNGGRHDERWNSGRRDHA